VGRALSFNHLILLKFKIAGILNLQRNELLTLREEGP
jgi:hypothetical protein